MAITEAEHGAFDIDAQVTRHAGAHLRCVHIAAPIPRRQGGPHLAESRSHAHGAVHRIQRQCRGEVGIGGGVSDHRVGAVDLIDPGAFQQRLMKHRGRGGGRQRPEERHGTAHPPGLAGLDRDEMHSQRVPGHRTVNVERPGLRIEHPRIAYLAGHIRGGAHPAAEAVEGPGGQNRPGTHRRDRCHAAECVGVRRGIGVGVRFPSQVIGHINQVRSCASATVLRPISA